MNIEQERTAFEAWYRLHHGSRDVYERDASGEYTDKQVQGVFNVWQARAALTVQLMPASIKETIIKALIFRHDAGEDQDACDNALNWLSQHAAPVAALEEAMLKARVEMRHCRTTQSVDADAHLISACDPDTIRALLDERDALAAEVERLADALREMLERGQRDEALLRQALEALESADWYIGQLELIVYSPDDTGTHEERAKVQSIIAALRERLGGSV